MADKNSLFAPMLNGAATNTFTNISPHADKPNINLLGDAVIKKGDMTVFIDKYNELPSALRISAHKLLDFCTVKLTEQNSLKAASPNTTVKFRLKEYAQMCGIPDTKPSMDKFRRKVKADLDALFRVSMEWKEPSRRECKEARSFTKTRICTSIGMRNGIVNMTFSPELANYLIQSYIMLYPLGVLKIDERNPSAYHIGKKLLLHSSNGNNQKSGTANTISVKSLLAVCPDIPSYEEVLNSSNRSFRERIVKPFEKALNTLNFLTGWEYYRKTDRVEKSDALKMAFYDFERLNIRFAVKEKEQ